MPSPQSPEESEGRPGPTFEAIYEAHFTYVWHTLRRYGVAERFLEDVVHDVFVVVHRTMGKYDPARPVKPWLCGIAFRVGSDHNRRRANQEIPEDPTEREERLPAAGERLDEASEARDLVARALKALDQNRREVLILCDLQRMTAAEAAEVLKIPANTVYSRLKVAREEFRSAVGRLCPKEEILS